MIFSKQNLEDCIKSYKPNQINLIANKSKKSWIQTYTGKKFFPLDPNFDDICIEDIAHSLSNQCRFSGHVKEFYSVAQHCVLVSYLTEDNLPGLMHDSSEAYLVDIPKPLKDSGEFESYKKYELNLQTMIYIKYCNLQLEPVSVKMADMIMLSTEASQLLNELHPEFILPTIPLEYKIEPWAPKEAERLFLDRFKELNEQRRF